MKKYNLCIGTEAKYLQKLFDLYELRNSRALELR